ncbi:MAG: hypothetical protein HWN69_02320 [Desulfobacterales bacterium]|nr:hypothetical protein [Desulfobacterales bacterium]
MMKVEEICKKCCSRLKEKIELLSSYKLATSKIKETLELKDLRRLGRYLKERQRLIDKIEQIDKEVNMLTRENGFSIEKLSEKARDLFRGYVDRIRDVLESLSGIDKGCLDLARTEHDSVKSEILKIQQGRRVVNGYRQARRQTPRFLDMKR